MATRRRRLPRKNKTRRLPLKRFKHIATVVPNHTPSFIDVISRKIYEWFAGKSSHEQHIEQVIDRNHPSTLLQMNKQVQQSYAPSINRDLVSIRKTLPRQDLIDCNNTAAFELRQPIQIKVKGKCFPYNTPTAQQFLLKNLAANKHVEPSKIVPPIQIQSNCWFNTLFVSFFISDKGRKFFLFLRQMMILGKQADERKITGKLRDAFALLNFGIDAALTGNEFAYQLNTNAIIRLIYDSIPTEFKKSHPFIRTVDQSNAPFLYYFSIIAFLKNNDISVLYVDRATDQWKHSAAQRMEGTTHLPHIVVLEVNDDSLDTFRQKPTSFHIGNAKYQLDSAIVRDVSKRHFCAVLTVEGQEYAYDGLSFHRISKMKWKEKLNLDAHWTFQGSVTNNGTPLQWNFAHSAQFLMYYRV